jgi:bifunctional non-homologous end joining protein LigD
MLTRWVKTPHAQRRRDVLFYGMRIVSGTTGIIPSDRETATLALDGHRIALTNLRKVYFPKTGLTKGDLLAYYLAVADTILPHVSDRAVVMKRYPDGVDGPFFYMKRAPAVRPDWVRTCSIEHGSGSTIDFPVIDDRASLLWMINLGCIDLNPWYSLCDDPDRPLYLHFDLDPTEGTSFSIVREAALIVRDVLEGLGMRPFVKTSGSTGAHVYVAIRTGPRQREVWEIAKEIGWQVANAHPDVLTAEYRVAKRPGGHVLIDYNQNAFGKTLASVYSVRPNAEALVSTPVTWEEIKDGCEPSDFTLRTVPARIARLGDLWKPLLNRRGRFDLQRAWRRPRASV